jgi:signal transduction histidine kinase
MRGTRNADRLRPRSVRAKIVSLLMLPIVSLMALWGFAAVNTASNIGDLQRLKEVNSQLLTPLDAFTTALQAERAAAVRGEGKKLTAAQKATDAAATALQDGINSSSADAGLLDSSLPGRISRLDKDISALATLRTDTSFDTRYADYTAVIEHGFAVTGALTGLQDTEVTSEARVVLELSRAREAIAREDAVLGAASAKGTLTKKQYGVFVGAVATQRLLLQPAIADLHAADRTTYNAIVSGADFKNLRSAENSVQSAGPGDSAVSVNSLADWDASAANVLKDLGRAQSAAGTAAAAAVNPFGLATLGGSGIAVVLGLVGVLLSLLVSVRVGRGLIVELLDLRNSALDVAGRRLPQAMRRLHAGQGVDIDAEAPVRRLIGDELAQVGTALNAVQRAALKAASQRAELLSGISGVYVSIARRSQVLLHRQLDLLDTMERRNHDPVELEDLYRLDYLTTRMRRHSESLLILSGIPAGRGWRDPIPLVDVLRAAVAEIEDINRVQVREVPPVSLAGPAVADVIHLLAELVENASSFSPPSTKVEVRAQVGHDGLLLEIEDCGFGMKDDALAAANSKLQSQRVDLLDTKQLGLFVVNRLAQRQDIHVELRHSPAGGVTVVVLLPAALLREQPAPVRVAAGYDRGLAPAAALIPNQRHS